MIDADFGLVAAGTSVFILDLPLFSTVRKKARHRDNEGDFG
jgi:hypothetical protein